MKGSGDPAGAVIRLLPGPPIATGLLGPPLSAGVAKRLGGSSLLGENGFQCSPDECDAAIMLLLAAGAGLPAPSPVLPPCCCIHKVTNPGNILVAYCAPLVMQTAFSSWECRLPFHQPCSSTDAVLSLLTCGAAPGLLPHTA